MTIAIDPRSVKKSGGGTQSQSLAAQDFSVFMGAMAPAGAQTTVTSGGNGQEAAVTQAAMTGLSGASAPYNAPYTSGMGGGGPGFVGTTVSPFDPNQAAPGTGAGATPAGAGAGSATGLPFSNPSNDFMEKDFLLTKMNDSAMNMLVLQAQVQDQNRNYTLVSNMLQSRDRTLHNMIQNIRGM